MHGPLSCEPFQTIARYRTCQLIITTRPLALGREPVVQPVELAAVSEAEADGRLPQVHEPATQSSIHEWQRRPLGSCKYPQPRLRPGSAHVLTRFLESMERQLSG